MPFSTEGCGRLAIWTMAAVLMQMLGLSLFMIGFFPVKPTLSGFSGLDGFLRPTCNASQDLRRLSLPPDQLRPLYKDISEIPPLFDRLVLMVVDGLPAEFVLGKGDRPPTKATMEAMPYTQSLLSSGRATGYHAIAAPPTVTMPRLKAMVSGAVSGFLDVAFNFNTQEFLDDNLLVQFFSIGWKMVMLGDETWIKLFPGLFTRQDGVSSFYVKDTVEVDHNVSRHLEIELETSDWNLLILHYLGLDHVGHIGGRHSILMAPKLKEMDAVIKRIHLSAILHQKDLDKHTLLMVVSDHGMTESGNHGGSSYEETDSLVLFISLGSKFLDHASTTHNTVFQVDIAPTLALLFGVPIPKNSVGVLIPRILDSLTDEQRLRALELNSWQILRLLQAQLPGLLCGQSPCSGFSDGQIPQISKFDDNISAKLCSLFSKATAFHDSWKSERGSRTDSTEALQVATRAYYEFLRNATEWLSRRVTDKPLNLLASGIGLIVLSCVTLLSLLFRLCREVSLKQMLCLSGLNGSFSRWHLDESFSWVAILVHALSLGSSSMVEEEQYIWSFLTSTLFLIFLRKTMQSVPGSAPTSSSVTKEQINTVHLSCRTGPVNKSFQLKDQDMYLQISSILLVLICGRLLRGWHQGGVNWTHLPDISKFLEDNGNLSIKSLQIASVLLVMIFASLALYLVKSMRVLVHVVQLSICITGLLVIFHILENQNHAAIIAIVNGTSLAQVIYAILGVTVTGTALLSPWIVPIPDQKTRQNSETNSTSFCVDMKIESLLMGVRDSVSLTGRTYVVCWCMLHLLLQQPINSVPILLLLLQILASMICFSTDGYLRKEWVEVAAMYFLGMSGHFGLGNSNGLATVDVAGAFIGISSHSTILSGILLFVITYASPLLFLLGLTMYVPVKGVKYPSALQNADFGFHLKMMIGTPCLLPLGLNSIVLTSFTIILLLMRNHLFVWSVFSPKYLYVCAATVSVYIGVFVVAATGVYTCLVLFLRIWHSVLRGHF